MKACNWCRKLLPTTAVEEARAQSARSQARAADDEGPADEVTRARARQILRARGR